MSRTRGPVKPEQHGTITGYTNGCRCTPCTAENTRAVTAARRRRALGIHSPTDRIPAQHTMLVFAHLRDRGYTDPQLARLSGLSAQTVTEVRKGRRKHVTRETVDLVDAAWALLERVPPQDRLGDRYVHAGGARLRIRALMTQGWSMEALGLRLGYSTGYLSPLLYGSRRITPRLHRTVCALYDELWAQQGPSTSTAKRAARRGWASPLELDEDLLDDPAYEPVLHRLDPVAARREARDGRRQQVAELTARGLSIRQISDRLGVDPRQVVRDRGVIREAS